MKKQKGEIATGAAIVFFLWGLFTAIIVPDAYYDANKGAECPEKLQDTTKDQRELCYVQKDADEIGYKVVEK